MKNDDVIEEKAEFAHEQYTLTLKHDFAREIMDLIWCGEYSTGEKEEDER